MPRYSPNPYGPYGHKIRPKTNNMDLYFEAVEQVAETWQTVKKIPNYEAVVGELLFRQLFEIAPVALKLYSFGDDVEIGDASKVPDAVFESPLFRAHVSGVVTMLETVIVLMLGHDMDTLATSLHALGSRHVGYGVHPAHYGAVETALIRTLAGALGEQFTDEVRKGWAAVFKFISKGMMAGAGSELEIMKEQRRTLERNKSAMLRLKVIGNSKGISRLSRSGVSTRRPSTDGTPYKTPVKRCDTAPPRMPSRRSPHDPGSIVSGEKANPRRRRSSDLSPFRESEEDLETSCNDRKARPSSHSQDKAPSSRAPRRGLRPKRNDDPTPNIIVFASPDKTAHDSAPRQPTRRSTAMNDDSEEDFLMCKVTRGPGYHDMHDSVDLTVDSSGHDSEIHPEKYWRDETIKVVVAEPVISSDNYWVADDSRVPSKVSKRQVELRAA